MFLTAMAGNPLAVLPIDVLSPEDLRRAGAVNGELGSALQALLPSFNIPRQSNSGGADHIRAAQLRGLSPDQVLVLDDVFAELDTDRRARLAGMVEGFEQVIVTAAVEEDVPPALRARTVRVVAGTIEVAQYNVRATGHVAKLRRDLSV